MAFFIGPARKDEKLYCAIKNNLYMPLRMTYVAVKIKSFSTI